MPDVRAESEWLISLEERSKTAFLLSLANELTLVGRASYVPQSDDLRHPAWLRCINEIQHRVLACLSEVMRGTGSASFQRSIADWVLSQRDRALAEYLGNAWARAKERSCRRADTVREDSDGNSELGAGPYDH
jgi:hypothetical protein